MTVHPTPSYTNEVISFQVRLRSELMTPEEIWNTTPRNIDHLGLKLSCKAHNQITERSFVTVCIRNVALLSIIIHTQWNN